MWKWIVGILLLVVILIGGTCYRLFKRVTEGGNVAVVTVQGSAEHVFAALTDADSMQAWMPTGTTITPLGHGALKAGDSLQISHRRSGADSATQPVARIWVVREVISPTVVVFEQLGFDGVGAAFVEVSRRDSVVAMGDSTMIYTTVNKVRMPNGAETKGDSAVAGVAQKLLIGSKRLEAEAELEMLKFHIERPKQP